MELSLTALIVLATANNTTGATFLREDKAWQIDMNVVKRKDKECTSIKEDIKSTMDQRNEVSKILNWIITSGDAKNIEPSHEEIMERTGMGSDNYPHAAEWFLSSVLEPWLYAAKTDVETDGDHADKVENATQLENEAKETTRVLWLKGTSEYHIPDEIYLADTDHSENGEDDHHVSVRYVVYLLTATDNLKGVRLYLD